ncbi:MAG TPA: FKBP-type peptidyl-prolyl cis-trans isomerase [Phycisphaerales bacterium]|nr:FKBP-type peptidyl-prolyl cis-trans isomerase [Phycisphaerales bacterium]
MRTKLAFLAFTLSSTALLAQTAPPSSPQTPPSAAAAPVTPPSPNAIPVPDGPVVNRQELEGGLVIEDIKIGEGAEVKPGGAFIGYYHGTRKNDGGVIDSSFDRGERTPLPLAAMIPGWQKGVPGMRIGGIRRLIIPAAMGYGAAGRAPQVPPNTDLVFVIQVLDAIAVEDIKEGDGEAATTQFVPVTTHVIRDAEGKEIERSDKPYVWIPGELNGLTAGLEGMKVGGKRRIRIPKEFNMGSPQFAPATRPQNVALEVELELIAVRNLPTGRR